MPLDPNPPRPEAYLNGDIYVRHQAVTDNLGSGISSKVGYLYGPIYLSPVGGNYKRGMAFVNEDGETFGQFRFDGVINIRGIVIGEVEDVDIELADGLGTFFRNALGVYVAHLTVDGNLRVKTPVILNEAITLEIAAGTPDQSEALARVVGPFPRTVIVGANASYPILQILNSASVPVLKITQSGTIEVSQGVIQSSEESTSIVYGSIDFNEV